MRSPTIASPRTLRRSWDIKCSEGGSKIEDGGWKMEDRGSPVQSRSTTRFAV
jgi:hypothetical protein